MIPLKYQLDKKLIEQIRKDERDKILEKIELIIMKSEWIHPKLRLKVFQDLKKEINK